MKTLTFKVYIKIQDKNDPIVSDHRPTIGIKTEDGSYGDYDYAEHQNMSDILKYDVPKFLDLIRKDLLFIIEPFQNV